jgi:hypothetical protein
MINIYKNLVSKTFDDGSKSELVSDLGTICRMNGISPIFSMTEKEAIALEYSFIASYDKVLGPIYECFDKYLNLEITTIGLDDFYPVLNSIKRDKKVKDFYLALISKSSFYNIVSTSTIRLPGVAHFMSRYSRISDLGTDNCCTLL